MTDEEIFKFLREQEEALNNKLVFYVHYDPTTNGITSFRNYLDSTDPFPHYVFKEDDISFSLDKMDIASLSLVIEDGKSKLEKIEVPDISIKTIDEFIYEVPKEVSDTRLTANERTFDLLIEQNNPIGEFRIKLSKALREKFSLQSRDSQLICLYVTAVNDPNILYKTLTVTIGELISNEYYTIPFEDFQGDDVNIYGLKYFENYLHVDIR